MRVERIEKWVYFYAAGADTGSFLARLASYAVDTLADGHGSRAFILSARGKIQVGFECYRLNSAAHILCCHAEQAETFTRLLDMYHFGEDFELCPMDVTQAYFTAGTADQEPLSQFHIGDMNALDYAARTCRFRDRDYRVLKTARYGHPVYMIAPVAEGPDPLLAEFSLIHQTDIGFDHLEYERIAHCIPSAPNEFIDTYTPLDIGALDGITDGKGCYPGQEVIERTIALGRPSMKLVAVSAQTRLKMNQDVSHDGRVVGRITSCVNTGETASIGLAVLKYRSADLESWTIADGDLKKRPLSSE